MSEVALIVKTLHFGNAVYCCRERARHCFDSYKSPWRWPWAHTDSIPRFWHAHTQTWPDGGHGHTHRHTLIQMKQPNRLNSLKIPLKTWLLLLKNQTGVDNVEVIGQSSNSPHSSQNTASQNITAREKVTITAIHLEPVHKCSSFNPPTLVCCHSEWCSPRWSFYHLNLTFRPLDTSDWSRNRNSLMRGKTVGRFLGFLHF